MILPWQPIPRLKVGLGFYRLPVVFVPLGRSVVRFWSAKQSRWLRKDVVANTCEPEIPDVVLHEDQPLLLMTLDQCQIGWGTMFWLSAAPPAGLGLHWFPNSPETAVAVPIQQ